MGKYIDIGNRWSIIKRETNEYFSKIMKKVRITWKL